MLALALVGLAAAGCGEPKVTVIDLKVGEGPAARFGDFVEVNYTGWLSDGKEFDSSKKAGQPLSFQIGLGQGIKGWHDGILGMKVGGKRKLIIPPQFAYGPAGVPKAGIPANAELTYEVELVKLTALEDRKKEPEKKATETKLNNPSIDDKDDKADDAPATEEGKEYETKSGLKFLERKIGTGRKAKAGDNVSVHYVGTLTNGKKFDSSRDRDDPIKFTLGRGMVIKGWDEGIAGMKVGGKRKLTIPSELGYGKRGAGKDIPPDATLIFEVELMDAK
jgi:peptidylprolyl isomerase